MGEPVWALGSFGLDRMDKIFPEPPPPKKDIRDCACADVYWGRGAGWKGAADLPWKIQISARHPPPEKWSGSSHAVNTYLTISF